MRSLRRFTGETFASLRHRNFRLFFIGQFTSQTGNWLTLVTQVLLVLQLTDSGVALGVLSAFQFGPILVLGPFAGLVADRADKRRLLLVVQSLAMLQSFALAALAFSDTPPMAAIYAVAMLGGVTLAFDNPARRAFVADLVPESDINNAVSLNSAQMTSSRIVGPALAGLLVTTVGFGWTFVVDGASYVAVLIALWMIRSDEVRSGPRTVRGKGQVREGLRYARRTPEVWVPLVMLADVGALAFNFQTVFPLFATRDLGGSDTTFTILLSITSVGSLVGALIAARRSDITVSVVARSSLAFGVAMAVLALVPVPAIAYAVGVAVGLTSILFLTALTAIVQLRAEPAMRGRVLALQAMVFLGSTPIGGPILGALSQFAGARWGVAVGALAALLAGWWGLVRARAIDGSADQPVPRSLEVAVVNPAGTGPGR